MQYRLPINIMQLSDRRYKQVRKLQSIIDVYENKLQQRIDQTVSQIITNSTLMNDQSSKYRRQQRDDKLQNIPHIPRRKNPSLIRNRALSLVSSIYENQQAMDAVTEKYKQQMAPKIFAPEGRAVGRNKITKPKFTRKTPTILPKEMRLNPFCDRNAIKAHELEQGMLSLLEKGRIAKDVNIITAFQKGNPVLQTSKAIFHSGEERFVELSLEKEKTVVGETKEEGWALTMPQQYPRREKQEIKWPRSQPLDLTSSTYIKILQYSLVVDQHFSYFKTNNYEIFPAISQLLAQITKILKSYAVELAYVDSKKVLKYAAMLRRPREAEIKECIVQGHELLKVSHIKHYGCKEIWSKTIVEACIRSHFQRKKFLSYVVKNRVIDRIRMWAYIRVCARRHKEGAKEREQIKRSKFTLLQEKFRKQCDAIKQNKHYQIHVANESVRSGQGQREAMHTQLTRLFSLDNINTHLIYLLPGELDPQAINYYFKIMELEQIPNYRQRVSFLEVDPFHLLPPHISLSSKLLYSSLAIRKLKTKIGSHPAFFQTSYLSSVDMQLAVYFNIPIFAGDFTRTPQLLMRSHVQPIFKTPHLPYICIAPHSNLTDICSQLRQFYQQRRCSRLLLKINGVHQSSGLASLTAPFVSLPQMQSSTVVIQQYRCTVQNYYLQLARKGGVAEPYEENISSIVVVAHFTADGQLEIQGTFDKIVVSCVNVAYVFPQSQIQHRRILEGMEGIGNKLRELNHFGAVEVTYLILKKEMYLQKVQPYLTRIGSSLCYFRFLVEGRMNSLGQYMAKLIDGEGGQQTILEPRHYCYIPYMLHFGLSDRQISSFFQLCRMGGVSFDLENKHGATFILLGSLRNTIGLITTAKDSKVNFRLMVKTLDFILKQNSHNSWAVKEKEHRIRQRQNILTLKAKLQPHAM